MNDFKLNLNNISKFVSDKEIKDYEDLANNAREKLLNKNGRGSDYIGWVDWPVIVTNEDVKAICKAAKEIRENNDCLVVIGIGGSYLGAKAAIDMLGKYFKNDGELEIIFLGNTLSPEYTKEVIDYLKNKDFAINVISKSGSTIEPAIAFRLIRDLMFDKYGKNYTQRVYTTNSSTSGILHNMAIKNKYQEFFIPDSIGGRYSVLTAVGLLPIAAAGFDIIQILNGAMSARDRFVNTEFKKNDALLYASIRNILYKKEKNIELLVAYEPKLRYFGEWWKQLFGESEGKESKGIFPASLIYTTDLHSMGQYVQDGERKLFETVINFKSSKSDISVLIDNDDSDRLNYLGEKTLNYINKQAMNGTISAHVEGGVPNILIELEECNEFSFGYLVYFFMFSCGISGYLLDVNPFNQEGVEAYKKNMFRLLDKPDFKK